MVVVAPSSGNSLAIATEASLSVAGGESNVASYLANLGIPASWVSRVGNDALGQLVRARVAATGVDISRVRVADGYPTGVMFKDPQSSGSGVYYYRAGSAASTMSPIDGDGIDYGAVSAVHVTGVTLAISDGCRRLVENQFAKAGREGVLRSFDVNYRPSLWDHGDAASVLREFACRADLVFVGRDEAERVWGTVSAGDVRELLNVPMLVVKDGAIGATLFRGDEEIFLPSPRVDVVEPIGAGDAFAAGFLAGELKGLSAERSLGLGHELAALALSSVEDHVDGSAVSSWLGSKNV